MSSSHRVILKKTPSVKIAESVGVKNPLTSAGNVLGGLGSITGILKGELGKFETKLKTEASTLLAKEATKLTGTLSTSIANTVGGSDANKKSTTSKMNQVIGSTVDTYKKELLGKIKI